MRDPIAVLASALVMPHIPHPTSCGESPVLLGARSIRPILALGLLLVLVDASLALFWNGRHAVPYPLNPLLLVNEERSVMTWLTIGLTFSFGITCLALGLMERRKGWHAVGGLFLFLSLDDQILFHERVGAFVERRIGGEHAYGWIVVLAPVFAVLGVFAFLFLSRRFAEEAHGRRCVAIAFAGMGISLFLEAVEKRLLQSGPQIGGFKLSGYLISLEEFSELLAPTLLFACATSAIERRMREPRFTARPRYDECRLTARGLTRTRRAS